MRSVGAGCSSVPSRYPRVRRQPGAIGTDRRDKAGLFIRAANTERPAQCRKPRSALACLTRLHRAAYPDRRALPAAGQARRRDVLTGLVTRGEAKRLLRQYDAGPNWSMLGLDARLHLPAAKSGVSLWAHNEAAALV